MAAPSLVGVASASVNGTGASAAVSMTPSAGNSLVAFICFNDNTNAPVTSVSGCGGTWSAAAQSAGGAFHNHAEIWVGRNCTGGAGTVTVNFPASDIYNVVCQETTPLAAVDKTAINTVFNSNPDSGTTAATTTADEIVFAMFVDETNANGGTTPASSGYTSITDQRSAGALKSFEASYKTVAATGTQNATWGTLTAGARWEACIATFASGAAAVTTYAPSQLGSSLHPGKTMNANARFAQTKQGIVPRLGVVFRKTLSGIGTRTGSRQVHN